MTNEITKKEGISTQELTLHEIENQVILIQKVMKSVMKENEHYGKIPGCGNKPTLLKAGAEKLALTFRFAPSYKITKSGYPNRHREYEIITTLTNINNGKLFGEGIGSCSTMENKYKYRNKNLICPVCGKETIIKGKKEYGGGFICYGKKGGCGEKFSETDNKIINQEVGKIEHDNPADHYNCITPDTKILTHDLQWVPAGEVESGDILIGVEENLTDQYARHMAMGKATVYGRKLDDLYKIIFEDWRSIRCNGEHQWLVKKIGLKGTEWVSTQDIYKEILERKGRSRHWHVMSLCTPWIEDTSKEAGYIAGLLDADGSLGSTQLCVMFAQQPNVVLALFKQGLINRGYHLGFHAIKTPEAIEQSVSKQQVYNVRILGGFTEQLRLLGTIRPPRLLERWLNFWDLSNRRLEGRGSGAGKPTRIISIEPIGEGEIVMLGTSCHTYLAEGLICHNTILKMAKKRSLVDAVLTATAASDIFTQDLEDLVENQVLPQSTQEKKPTVEKPKEKEPTPEKPKEEKPVELNSYLKIKLEEYEECLKAEKAAPEELKDSYLKWAINEAEGKSSAEKGQLRLFYSKVDKIYTRKYA